MKAKTLFQRSVAMLMATLMAMPVKAAEVITYFHNDVSGSPMMATDASGAVLWKETYKPYGDKLNRQPASATNKIGFHGKPFDDNSGLSYMSARYYDPVIGRFMGIDPVDFQEDNLHSFNRYNYANNNPHKYVDPDGHNPLVAALLAALSLLGMLGGASNGGKGFGTGPGGKSDNRTQEEKALGIPPSQGSGRSTPTTTNNESGEGKAEKPPSESNPMEGAPGSCSSCNNNKGNKKQDRYYGSDGWPDKDIDYDHDHKGSDGKKVGMPHAHDWGRPPGGGRPTAENRGPARPLRPEEKK